MGYEIQEEIDKAVKEFKKSFDDHNIKVISSGKEIKIPWSAWIRSGVEMGAAFSAKKKWSDDFNLLLNSCPCDQLLGSHITQAYSLLESLQKKLKGF